MAGIEADRSGDELRAVARLLPVVALNSSACGQHRDTTTGRQDRDEVVSPCIPLVLGDRIGHVIGWDKDRASEVSWLVAAHWPPSEDGERLAYNSFRSEA
jgi:hypothetical protein